MKQLKMSMVVLLIATFFSSCNEEITLVPESGDLNAKTSAIDNVSARPGSMEIYGGELYALYAWDAYNSVYLYNYNAINDVLDFDYDYIGATGHNRNFGFDYNYKDGFIYLLAGESEWEYENAGYRNLYTWNKDTNEKILLEQIISDEGDERPQDLTFGNDGTLYFAFKNGEINAYNVATKTMSAFSTMDGWKGGVGLTYDFDNNRLIYARGYDPVSLYSIEIPSGEVNFLFSFYATNYYDFGNAIEYVGNNKLLVSGRNMNTITTVDLETEDVNFLSDSYIYQIKDLMFFVNPDLDDDGVLNENDPYPNSNVAETLSIGEINLNIDNEFVKSGTTMMDQIDALIAAINEEYTGDNYAVLHKKFMTELSKITYYWYKGRMITSRERSAISSAAWRANVPYYMNQS
ncbi:hypothetical protein [Lutibacter sp.]|uniref:hypothetical protein n=1 Tax=Lutibacter sp. TaxID=1925666 RepID=UPI001A21906D|nr:hypothetical protein [Lutibacter sp.]MBI9042683.1 hypothetical protein [Lutibacter sp.]